jgi:hypothetical protein
MSAGQLTTDMNVRLQWLNLADQWEALSDQLEPPPEKDGRNQS